MRKFLLTCLMLTLVALVGCQKGKSLEGKWEGTMDVKVAKLRLIVNINKTSDGKYTGTLQSPDQANLSLGIDTAELKDDAVNLTLKLPTGPASFEGKLNETGEEMSGQWKQRGQSFPLTLKRSTEAKQ